MIFSDELVKRYDVCVRNTFSAEELVEKYRKKTEKIMNAIKTGKYKNKTTI